MIAQRDKLRRLATNQYKIPELRATAFRNCVEIKCTFCGGRMLPGEICGRCKIIIILFVIGKAYDFLDFFE